MSSRFNLLNTLSGDNNLIRVSRVDERRGIISDLTVEQANLWSFSNPGETYIFVDGNNNVHYLGINDVNKLKNKHLKRTIKCDTSVKECGPPKIKIFGGGGIAAAANPVISSTGAILAVDVIHGGYGYSTTPKAIVQDLCEIGGGATLQVVLGEQPFFEEYFDITEEVSIPDPDENAVAEGNLPNFDANGKALGTEFNPRKYFAGSDAIEAEAASAGELFDPIQEQIAEYEKLVRSLKNPWWTTRSGQPGKLTINGEPLSQVYPVVMPPYLRKAFDENGTTPWDYFLDEYGISPTPTSDVPGSDFAGRLFVHEYVINFPIDGDYIFRGMCDNEGLVYLDYEKIMDVTGFGKIKTFKKHVKKGIHRLRLDLLNVPIFEANSITDIQIFDTVKSIDKADRKLYRVDPTSSGTKSASFISQYGISPFSFNTPEAQEDSFAGTHVIRWEYIDFPVDGEYEVTIDSDDDVKIFIGNREGGGAKEIGNGLRDIRRGGDETIIDYTGFRSPGRPNPPLTQTISLKKGKYRLRAELKQIDVGPLGKGNPMALAIEIKSKRIEKNIISAKSWNQNPMAIALTIQAPEPGPPPVENIKKEGRCKDNPIWSTRHPGASQQWYPVEIAKDKGGNPYLNRYTMSPVPPLDTPNSDGSGIVWRNDWIVDIPYPGKYRVDGARADTARILIDDKVVTGLTGPYGGPALEWVQKNFAGWDDPKTNNSRVGRKSTFVDLEQGKHKISVELVNVPQVQQVLINEEIFGAHYWIGNVTPKATTVETKREEWVLVDDIFTPPAVRGGRGGDGSVTITSDATFHRYNEGTYYKGKKIRPGGDWNNTNPNTNYFEWDTNTRLTLGTYYPSAGQRFGIKVWQKKIVASQEVKITAEQTAYTREGVTYSGPQLMKFSHPRWSSYFNKFSVCPYFPDLDSENPEIVNEFVYTWTNIKFPESSQYDVSFAADNTSELFIDGVKVLDGRGFGLNEPAWRKVNVTEGIHTIQVKVVNLPSSNIFRNNPTGLLLRIRVPRLIDGDGASWKENPIGISAALVAPPCPKAGGGVGIVTAIIPIDPGNGYIPIAGNNTYNVGLELQEIIPVDPGIGYELGPIDVEGPAQAEICEIGPNGEILKVCVTPGLGYVDYPFITVPAENPGYNAILTPIFKVVRDPLFIEEEKLVQVTDLAGLKQTGYVFGRPYYGAVFYKDGTRYAGYYETAGDLIQVYDTLKESIDSQVTTAPSAIQRQGTDISSNDPRLNIPNTPSDGINFN